MLLRQVGIFLLAVCALLLTCAPALAQPEKTDSEAPSPEEAAPTESPPSNRQLGTDHTIFGLEYEIKIPDETGKLVLIPNMPLEVYREIWRIWQNLKNPGPPLPNYTLQDLSITGTATGKQAELTATIAIRPLRDGWVRVPLRLSNAFLLEAKYDQVVDLSVRYEKDDGYVCYVKAPKDKLHAISMLLAVPVRQVGSEKHLTLQTPRAASSGLKLRVPLKEVKATANNDLPVGVEVQGEETLLTVTGLGDDFQMAWREGTVEPTDVGPLLEVRSETLVEVVGERNANSDVRLVVNRLRGTINSVNIRLPAGTRLSDGQPSQSGLHVATAADDEESDITIVQVKPEQPTKGPLEVNLWLELAPTAGGMGPEFELGGLDVEHAVRQSGWIDIGVSDETSDQLTPTWEPGPNVLETLVPENLKQKVDARFEFTRSPYSLRMRVSTTPRKTEISIEPTYVFHIESSRIVLDATLNYRVRGAVPSSVTVDMPGWQVSTVSSPEPVVNEETLDPTRPGPLVVPLRSLAAPEGQRFTLEIHATREIADPSAVVAFSPPRPDAKILTPATVVVQPANNVELTVVEDDMEGLERESFPPEIDLPERQQAAIFYRERSDARTDAKPTVFAATLRVRQRAVSVGGDCSLEVDLRSVRVKQQLLYRIAYEPLDRVPLIVPRSVLAGGLSILCDGDPMRYDPMKGDEEGPRKVGPARIQVDLQRERIGRCDIVVEHKHFVSDLAAGQNNSLQVPLVVPQASEETTVAGSILRIPPSEDAQVEVAAGDWVAAEEGPESLDGEQTLKSTAIPSIASLRITRSKPRRQMSTSVSRAWIQTWLDSARRHERAVFRVRTNRKQIEIRLPDQATIEDVALDGRRVFASEDHAQSITLDLPEESASGEHVVELWYHTTRKQGLIDRVGLSPPVIADAKGSNYWYWQLATPPGEHLLDSPEGMTPEMTWQQQGLLLGRRPRLGQTEIERWIGATAQTPVPETLNQYLFSSFGEVSERHCATADRRAILLAVSGFALLLGLALLYVPRLRHPGLLFAAGVVLVSAVLLYPSLSVGIAQASCLGLVLVVAAGLLKWFLDLPQTRGVLISGAPYSSPDSKTVKGPASPIDSHAARPTTTIQASAAVSAAESST